MYLQKFDFFHFRIYFCFRLRKILLFTSLTVSGSIMTLPNLSLASSTPKTLIHFDYKRIDYLKKATFFNLKYPICQI